MVTVVAVLAALFLIDQSRPSELLERPAPGEAKVYVDVSEALIALVALGALAVVVVALAGWRISRRAVAPLGVVLRLQRSFVADASHELRTPLTVLDSRLQLLQRRLEKGEPYADMLAAARRDTTTMIDLVVDLLLVAEASALGDGAVADLRPAVDGAAAALAVLAEQRGVVLQVQVENEARVPLSDLSLRRALIVLIDNAIVHSPLGGRVDVIATAVPGRATVRVRDQGSGVEGVDRQRMFDRFARGETTSGRRGFGIGLALVRDLAERHGGRVLVEQTSASGTTMRLELPVSR